MKQFTYEIKATISNDGYDVIEAKNQASAEKKLAQLETVFGQVESLFDSVPNSGNWSFEISSEILDETEGVDMVVKI